MVTSCDAPVQPTLFGAGPVEIDTTFAAVRRTELAHGAWFDLVPGWLAGEQTVYDQLVGSTSWHAQRRPMYDRMVDVPRLIATFPADGAGHDVFPAVTAALVARYGEPFERVSAAWYRDGRDSVAPHGDQVARQMPSTVMATVSCGARRRLLLSPVAGGPSIGVDLGHGDLFVMGGTIQRTWRHGVPKTARPVGPRLSVMFRPPWLG